MRANKLVVSTGSYTKPEFILFKQGPHVGLSIHQMNFNLVWNSRPESSIAIAEYILNIPLKVPGDITAGNDVYLNSRHTS
jgi:hypothetical protein